MAAERGEEAVEENWKLVNVYGYDTKVQGEAASITEAAASYSEDLAQIINESGYNKQLSM